MVNCGNRSRGFAVGCCPGGVLAGLARVALMMLCVWVFPAGGVESGAVHTREGVDHFMNLWAVKLVGGRDNAERVARELGYQNLGLIGEFEDTYLMKKLDHPHRSRREAFHLTRRLSDDVRVVWAEQQFAKLRTKRDAMMAAPEQEDRFNDPLWPHQWYLRDTRNMPDYRLPKLDLNVISVWQKGYTGKGVVVTVLDDGLEWNHTDIFQNYDPEASCDLNDNDRDPFPKYDHSDSNRHGTRCAGEIAMVSNNNKCGVGVAYDVKIGGIRMLDGPVSDLVEGRALSHNLTHIDVFSASWGPNDDGRTVEGPGRLGKEAFELGVTKGRGGKGVIYVWASGNGGSKFDNCNCDGYTASIYTLSVGSASQQGKFPWYGEKCASTMTSTYSSGAYSDQKICSTDLHNKCTIDHTGTSAAAPLAAGIIALILQANPNLTWRDIQHLVVLTSEFASLSSNSGWMTNGVGFKFNSRFGFGLMNANTMLTAALNWTNVPEKGMCRKDAQEKFPLSIESGRKITVTFKSDNCQSSPEEINYLEHVQVIVDIEYSRRGALEVYLESPNGTKTTLLLPRKKDFSTVGFQDWTFMSVHTWGENPGGAWTLLIQDRTSEGNVGQVKSAALILHGTREMPAHMRAGRRVYDLDFNRNENNLSQMSNDLNEGFAEPDPLSRLRDEMAVGQSLDWADLVGKRLRDAALSQSQSQSQSRSQSQSPGWGSWFNARSRFRGQSLPEEDFDFFD